MKSKHLHLIYVGLTAIFLVLFIIFIALYQGYENYIITYNYNNSSNSFYENWKPAEVASIANCAWAFLSLTLITIFAWVSHTIFSKKMREIFSKNRESEI